MRGLSGMGIIVTSVLGVIATGLSLFKFLRDKHHLRVSIRWYASGSPPDATAGYVRVWNEGRRAIQVTRVGLKVNNGKGFRYIPLHLSSLSQTISEAESTEFPFALADYGISDSWYNVGAFVEDCAGERYEAKK